MQNVTSLNLLNSAIFFTFSLFISFSAQAKEQASTKKVNDTFSSFLDNSKANAKTTSEVDKCLIRTTIQWTKKCDLNDQIFRRDFIIDLRELDLNSATERLINNQSFLKVLFSEHAAKKSKFIEERLRVFESEESVSSLTNQNFERALVLSNKTKELLKKENISTKTITYYCSDIILTGNETSNIYMSIKRNVFQDILSLLKKQKKVYCTNP